MRSNTAFWVYWTDSTEYGVSRPALRTVTCRPQPRIQMRYPVTTAALVVFMTFACKGSDSKTQAALNETSVDTSLAHDLALAGADTVLYAEAADVAMQEDTTTRVVTRPAPPTTAAKTQADDSRPRSATAPARPHQPSPSSPGGTSSAAASGGSSCASPEGPDQRRCLMQYLARSDASLNRTYQRVIRQSGPAEEERLRIAQRAWLVYRDTECRRKTKSSEGPLWAPVRARCLGEYSAAREQELAAMLR
jgi:uncharacterized protein YecT (DUF1311 family)